jgi:putative ABC transport system permease protein
MDVVPTLLPTALSILVLALATTVILRAYRVRHPFAGLGALLRGAIQLAILSVVLTGVIGSMLWVSVAVVVMFAAAVVTAARRIGFSWRVLGGVAGAMACGIGLSLAVVFATGAIELSARYLLATGGIVIGNAMTVAALTGMNLHGLIADRWPEVEGWLALGATPVRATEDLARESVRRSIIPSIDQIKTTGLVVLPGTFVGAIFGGLSPLEAGRFQLVVLAAILASASLVSVVLSRVLSLRVSAPVVPED